MDSKFKGGGYRKRNLPWGTTYCVYCQGAGCDKCRGRGYYVPDLETPIRPPPQRS